jgi:predicted HTH domain antitoxin
MAYNGKERPKTMSHVLEIHYDDDVLLQASLRREEFEREAPILLAAKLYEMGRLSSGRAAKLCGMERAEFLMALPRIGVAMSNLRAEDVDDDIRFAQRG